MESQLEKKTENHMATGDYGAALHFHSFQIQGVGIPCAEVQGF